MGLMDSLTRWFRGEPVSERSAMVYPPLLPGRDDWWPFVDFGGNLYGLGNLQTTMPNSKTEEIGDAAQQLIAAGYKANGIVFACEMTRVQVFSQARFQWQRIRRGQTDALFGTDALGILEKPWPGGTTGDLLAKMLEHADFGGNAYVTRRKGALRLMEPWNVSIVLGSESDDVTAIDLDADFLGIIYFPGGKGSGRAPIPLPRSEVAHFAPIPDPMARYRGMSWMTPVVREVMGDAAANVHKLQFFQNAGTPNLVVKRKDAATSASAFQEWVAMMEAGHRGVANAYKTLYLDNGADATAIGSDFQQLDFKVVQGAGETRIAAAAGTHPVIVGLSEGMQGSSLNAGNFNSARRLMADKTLWHLWSNVAGSLETIVPPPSGSRLWIDADGIPFLREDRKDAAEIQQVKATTIATYIDKGFTRDSAVAATVGEDPSLLRPDPNWVSVQVQASGDTAESPTNGKVPAGPAKAKTTAEA